MAAPFDLAEEIHMSKDKKPIESVDELYDSSMDAMKQIGSRNAIITRKLADMQCDFFNLCLDYGRRQLDVVEKSEAPSDIYAAQSEIASEFANHMMESISNTLNDLTELQSELAATEKPESTDSENPDDAGSENDEAREG